MFEYSFFDLSLSLSDERQQQQFMCVECQQNFDMSTVDTIYNSWDNVDDNDTKMCSNSLFPIAVHIMEIDNVAQIANNHKAVNEWETN